MRGLDRFLGLYLEHVRPALIGPESRARILAAASCLPAGLAESLAGFECCLGDPAPTADFFASAHAGTRSGSILAGTDPDERLPETLLAHPAWRSVAALASAWTRPEPGPLRVVRELVLELDTQTLDERLPIPSLFVGPGDSRDPVSTSGSFGLPPAPACELLFEVAERIGGRPLTPQVRDRLAAMLEALPHPGRLFQAGFMLARPSDTVRVCLRGVPREELPALAARLGWPGSPAEAREALARHARPFDRISMCLDVGEEVGPRLGFECFFYGKKQPIEEPRWHALVDALARDGLCLPEKGEALLRYPGSAHVLGGALGDGGQPTSLIHFRGLNHLKLVVEPGRPLSVKAYLLGGLLAPPRPDVARRPRDPLLHVAMLGRYQGVALEKRQTPYLKWPEQVQLETLAACNARCPFCPYETMPRQGVRMPDALIDKILEDLRDIPADHPFRFSPYKLSEPLLDPRLLDVLRKVSTTLPGAQIMVKTNGTPLTERILDGLESVHLRVFSVSVNECTDEAYERVMGLPFPLLLEKLDLLHERVRLSRFPAPVRLTRVGDGGAGDEAFSRWVLERYPLFEAGLLRCRNWLGRIPASTAEVLPVACTHCHTLSITATGVVALCVMDGLAEYPIGDAAQQHVLAIYNAERLRNIRENLVDRQAIEPCRRCNML